LLDFSNTKGTKWDYQVGIWSDRDSIPYDITIGADLMATPGVVIDPQGKQLVWDGVALPMADRGFAPTPQAHQLYYVNGGPLLKQMGGWVVGSGHSKVGVGTMCGGLGTPGELGGELKLPLHKSPTLFGGGLMLKLREPQGRGGHRVAHNY